MVLLPLRTDNRHNQAAARAEGTGKGFLYLSGFSAVGSSLFRQMETTAETTIPPIALNPLSWVWKKLGVNSGLPLLPSKQSAPLSHLD